MSSAQLPGGKVDAIDTPDLSAGRCYGSEFPDAWFSEEHHETAWAKRLCGRCPVRDACLEYSIAAAEPHGTWGGVGVGERRRIVRDRRAKAAQEAS